MAKVLQTLRKKAQATPLVGVILDSLKSENPTQNAPSIQAVLDNLQPKQLLLNPDFQVNQRGQSSYTSAGYGLDMWNFVATSSNQIFPINGGGILINKATSNQNVVRQFIDTINANDVGKEYTLVINIESDKEFIGMIGFGKQRENINIEVGNKIYFHTFTLNDDDIKDNGYVDILVLNVDNIVTNAPQIKIWYADLWEGDIAYPHVKNSYAYDLMECRQYVRRDDVILSTVFPYSTKRFMGRYNFEAMKSLPTVEVGRIGGYTDISGTTVMEASKEVITITKSVIIITFEFNENMKSGVNFWTTILLSCEPL